VADSAAALEEEHWLCPVEDRHRLDSRREGMVEGFSLGNHLLLVDYTARLFRDGKATLSRAVAEILNRLGSTGDHWHARLEKLRQGNLVGRFLATSRQRLRAVAERLGLRRVPNLGGCPAPSAGPEPKRERFAVSDPEDEFAPARDSPSREIRFTVRDL
jgi:hypothetical protein